MVHIVKTMFFAVIMCGCEWWTIKKLSIKELILLNYGVGEESLELQEHQTSQS